MKSLNTMDSYKVGLGLIAAIVVGAIGLVLLSQANFGKKGYTAVLAQAAGLRSGEQVEVHGVVVGKVTDVALDGQTVKVNFDMDSSMKLGDQSTASVKVATLLGTHYLDVNPAGTGSTQTIPKERTAVPYNLQDVLNQGTTTLTALDSKTLSKALVTLSDTFNASKTDVGPALQGISAVSNLINKRGSEIGDLLTASRAVAQELQADSANIVGLMQQGNLILAEINSRQAAIKQLLEGSTQLAGTVSSLIQSSKADLKPALASLDQVIQTLNGQAGQLQKGFDTLAPAVRYIANATGNGPWIDLWGQAPLLPITGGLGGL